MRNRDVLASGALEGRIHDVGKRSARIGRCAGSQRICVLHAGKAQGCERHEDEDQLCGRESFDRHQNEGDGNSSGAHAESGQHGDDCLSGRQVDAQAGGVVQICSDQFPNGRRAIVKWKPERINTAEGDLQLYRYRLLQDPTAPERHEPIDPFFDGACVPTDRWTYPASLAKEVYDAVGYYRTPNLPFEYDYSSFTAYVQEEETLIEDCYDATREQDDIVLWLMKNKPWDFFWFSNMPYDRLNHNMTRIEGNPDWSPEYEAKYGGGKVMLEFTQFIDKELARILKQLPEDAYFMMISDHGWGPVKKNFEPNSWLMEQGLLFVKPEVEGKKRTYDTDDIDWSRTKAYTLWNPGIFINLKGREPNGIVEYSEYEKLRDLIIAELKEDQGSRGTAVHPHCRPRGKYLQG